MTDGPVTGAPRWLGVAVLAAIAVGILLAVWLYERVSGVPVLG